ncbi:acrosin-like [Lacerta agilis]|uniref:acrosin-like n=1 Tax=Lacerta agilis TaxID=80427 RepID=UPI001419A894|nr:acrosin-like [Lacerta agilis]
MNKPMNERINRLKARQVPFALKLRIDEELDRLVELGVLKPVPNTPWKTPIITPVKPNSSPGSDGHFGGIQKCSWASPISFLSSQDGQEERTVHGVCGRRPLAGSHNLRVVGGSNVLPGTWPWMVSFQKTTYKGYFSFCGGSLISPRWVLSAAHCFQKPKDIPHITLSIGANRISKPGPDAQRRRIKRLVNHKFYEQFLNDTYSKIHNDISLVELNEPVNCTDYIQPACLPDNSVVVSLLSHCYVSGFGIMNVKTKKMPDIMQEGPVDIIPKTTCSSPDWWYDYILEENICAGKMERGIATCKGDSGGPLMCREQRSERYWVVGITSWGPPFCGEANKPAVYTSTQFYLDWIRKNTNEDFSLAKHPPLMAKPRPTPRPRPPPRPQPQPEQMAQRTSSQELYMVHASWNEAHGTGHLDSPPAPSLGPNCSSMVHAAGKVATEDKGPSLAWADLQAVGHN